MYLLYVLGYPDQRQGEVAVEEGNHLLPPPQGCKFLKIVLRSSCADLTIFIFRESARGSPSADASSTATSPSSPWPSSRRERLRWFSRWNNWISQWGLKGYIYWLRMCQSESISRNWLSPLIRSLDWPTTRSLAGWDPSAPARSGLCAWYASEYQDVLITALL